MKFSLKGMFIAVTAIAFWIWLSMAGYHAFTKVESGENLPSVSWLPKSATNVSYYKSYSFTAYEFEIPEADFVKWRGWKLKPIDKTVSVPRYCRMTAKLPLVGPNPTEAELCREAEAYAARSAWVADGLYYEYRQQNGGGTIVAYNRNLQKAFVWTQPR